MSNIFTSWMVACIMTMGKHYPAIFNGYRVWYVGAWRERMPKADNDNEFVIPNV